MWGREKKTAIIVATRSMSSSFEKKIKRSAELVFIFAEFLCHAHRSDATQFPLQSRLVYPRLATNPNRSSPALSVRHRWKRNKGPQGLRRLTARLSAELR